MPARAQSLQVLTTLAWVKKSQTSLLQTVVQAADTSIEWVPQFKLFLTQFGLPPRSIKLLCDILKMDQGMLDDLQVLRIHFAARLMVWETGDAEANGRQCEPVDWETLGIEGHEVAMVARRVSHLSARLSAPTRPTCGDRAWPVAWPHQGGGIRGAYLRAQLAVARNDLRIAVAWCEGLGTHDGLGDETAAGIVAQITRLEHELSRLDEVDPSTASAASVGLNDDGDPQPMRVSSVSAGMVIVPRHDGLDVDCAVGARALSSSPVGPNGCSMRECTNGMYFGFRHTCRMCHREVCSECTRYATVHDIYLNRIYVSPDCPRMGLGYISSLVDGRHPVCAKCHNDVTVKKAA